MNKIDIRITQDVVVIGVTLVNFKLVANLVQFGFVTPANGVSIGIGMALVDGQEFGTEPKRSAARTLPVHVAEKEEEEEEEEKANQEKG